MAGPDKRQKFPRSVTDFIDQDYIEKLSPEDRAKWVDQFNDEFYGAAFDEDPIHPDSARKDLYNAKNSRNADLFGRGLRTGGISAERALEREDETREILGEDPSLNPTYKKTLREFRALLPKDSKRTTKITKRFKAVQKKIEALTGAELHIGGKRVTPPKPGTLIKMAQSRLEKLKETHQVIMHLGHIVVNHDFKGSECEAAAKVLSWLDSYRLKLEDKIKGEEAKRG